VSCVRFGIWDKCFWVSWDACGIYLRFERGVWGLVVVLSWCIRAFAVCGISNFIVIRYRPIIDCTLYANNNNNNNGDVEIYSPKSVDTTKNFLNHHPTNSANLPNSPSPLNLSKSSSLKQTTSPTLPSLDFGIKYPNPSVT
jgi:hypothetical protein